MFHRLDIKTIFTENLYRIKQKVQDRFYTTTLDFTHDICDIFRVGIHTEPAPKPETSPAKESEKSSPSKKTVLDLRGRRSLAKRILKAVQPQLEFALRAEADITGKVAETQLKEFEQAIEGALATGPDSISLGGSIGDAEGDRDIEMTDAGEHKTNGHSKIKSDVEMEDADAPREDDVDAIIAVADDTIDTGALAEVNGNVSPSKPHINGNKSANTPPDTNGYSAAPDHMQPAPPTPPVSTRDISSDHVDFLTKGGIPWYLKDFQPEGTSLLQGNDGGASFNDIDMDEDAITSGDYGDVAAVAVSPSKAKKGKAKKKARRR